MWDFLYKYFNPFTAWQGYNLYGGYIVTGKIDAKTVRGIAFELFKAEIREEEGSVKNSMGNHVAYIDKLGYATGGIGHLFSALDKVKFPKQYDTVRSGRDARGYNRPLTTYSKNSASVIPKATVDAWFIADTGTAFNAAVNQATELGKYNADMIRGLALVCFQHGTAWNTVHKTAWAAMKTGSKDGAIKAINALNKSLWAKQTPDRVASFTATIKRQYGVA